MGGHSLLAVRFFSAIEEVFRKRLPVATLLSAPTIEQFAALLVQDDPREKLAYTLPVQPEGEEPPFFCVGAGPLLRPLSLELGSRQPFFSFGLEPGALYQLRTPYKMEELAGHLVSALRERQPQGPYYLGGFCQDGVFAYEVARQLTQQGQNVGLLALFETANPSPNAKVRVTNGLKRMVIRLGYRVNRLAQLMSGATRASMRSQMTEFELSITRVVKGVVWSILCHFRFLESRPGPPDLERILYLAAHSYKPKPLACPTVLFGCKDWPIASAGDPYFGWRELLTGPSETHEVPGDHAGIFGGNNVKILAEQLSACLLKAKQVDRSTHKATSGR